MENTQTKLENAADGLLMMSESDYPFDYFTTTDEVVDDNLILKLAGKPAGTLVEKTTLDYLLRNMTNPASGSVSPEIATRFSQLSTALKQELSEPEVYRVGDRQIDVFILGKTNEGVIAGMRTKLIET
ncbi:nuclease A inhibitor family protein [Mucilaginibacter paludis]|nr:nuclease A inhibitor family protein [Mucilaginibacter paludis]